MPRPYRWGILSTGHIAGVITEDLLRIPDEARITAVASRTQAKADAYGEQHGIEHRFASYEEMAASGEIDVVYIASPHSDHLASARMFLERGVAVLCEKPLTLTATEADELVGLARERGVFCMEAVWSRTHALLRQARELVADGAIGEVHHVAASFGFRGDFDDGHRLLDPAQGGGAILDLGVYPAHMADLFCGPADSVAGTGSRHPRTHVDVDAAAVLRHSRSDARPWLAASGATSTVRCSMLADLPNRLEVLGTEGRLSTEGFLISKELRLERSGSEPEVFTDTHEGHGYLPQLREVMRCLDAGLTETPLVPLDDTLAVARTLDAWMAAVPDGRA